ncbi:MAG: ankyrin repeat domain-containing protein [Cyanobacteria bacterium]|nr:ankyrin repeat domain-containing protein [Cyanobacteriota bacterium]
MIPTSLRFGSHFQLRFPNPIQHQDQMEQKHWQRNSAMEEYLYNNEKDGETVTLSLTMGDRTITSGGYGGDSGDNGLPMKRTNITNFKGPGANYDQKTGLMIACNPNGLDIICRDVYDNQVEAQLAKLAETLGEQVTITKVSSGIGPETPLNSLQRQIEKQYYDIPTNEERLQRHADFCNDMLTVMSQKLPPEQKLNSLNSNALNAIRFVLEKEHEDTSKLEAVINGVVDVNAVIPALQNRTMIHLAAGAQNLNAVKLLVSYGANLSTRNDDGDTVLHTALQFYNEFTENHTDVNQLKVIDYLLGKQPDLLNAQNEFGHTPLITAIRNYHIPAAIKLIEAGADVNLPAGESPDANRPPITPKMLALGLEYDQMPDTQIILDMLNARQAQAQPATPEQYKAWARTNLKF